MKHNDVHYTKYSKASKTWSRPLEEVVFYQNLVYYYLTSPRLFACFAGNMRSLKTALADRGWLVQADIFTIISLEVPVSEMKDVIAFSAALRLAVKEAKDKNKLSDRTAVAGIFARTEHLALVAAEELEKYPVQDHSALVAMLTDLGFKEEETGQRI